MMQSVYVRLLVKRIKRECAADLKASNSDGEYFSDEHCTFIAELSEIISAAEAEENDD